MYRAFLFLLILASTAFSQIPKTMSYQGVLTDASGKSVADGDTPMVFRLFDVAEGGSQLWEEKQTVTTENGIFNVILGKEVELALPFDRPYWLGIELSENGTELAPRIELTAAAYSLNAASVADSVVTGDKIADGQVVRSLNGVTDEVILSAGENINLSVDGQTVTISASGQVAESRNTLDGADGDPVDAVFVDDEGKVGIGTSEPDAILEVRVNSLSEQGIRIRNDNSGPISLRFNEGAPSRATLVYLFNKDEFLIKAIEPGSKLRLLATNDEGITIDSSGNVGIGTTSPSEQLEITGNFELPASTANAGIIKVDGDRFIHNFGGNNFFAGRNSGNLTTTGNQNTAIGSFTLDDNTSGRSNTAVGSGALTRNTTGDNNTAIGQSALAVNTGGSFNTATGIDALFSNRGDGNTGMGDRALSLTTTGDQNTAVGDSSLRSNTSGSFNTGIGSNADVSAGNLSNATAVGANAVVDASNKIRLGDDDVTEVETNAMFHSLSGGFKFPDGSVQTTASANNSSPWQTSGKDIFYDKGNIGIGTDNATNIVTVVKGSATDPIADAWTTYSSRRWKTNIKTIENPLETVQALRGVTYDWKKDGKHDIGLIAEEVGEVIPEIVVYEENGIDAKSVDYPRLVAVLIEAVKEQLVLIDRQGQEFRQSQKELQKLVARVNELEMQLHRPSLVQK